METLSFPSPSVILKPSPRLPPISDSQPKKPVKPRGNASKPANKPAVASTATQDGAVTKTKQTKSRNGMKNRSLTRTS